MDTAYHIFKSHPNFENIKFIVEPLIREKIMIGSDLPSDDCHKKIILEYSSKFKILDLTRL
jgi:hypothetical protein